MKLTKIALILTLILLTTSIGASLNVTQAQQLSYTYNFYGPYWLQPVGTLASGNSVTLNVLWVNGSIYTVALSSTNSYQTQIVTDTQITQVSWNASTALNVTSTISIRPITSSTDQSFYIYIPNPAYPAAYYFFSVTDFVGMTNAYLSVLANTNGASNTNLIYEVALNSIGTPSFLLQQYQLYTLKFVCDQGTYSQQFMAENTYSTSLSILNGVFPTTNATTLTASATRVNNSTISIYYVDPDSTTTSLTVSVTHIAGASTITDFTDTGGNSYNATLTVDSATDYTVHLTSLLTTGETYTYTIACPAPIVTTNPFTGLFDFLGNWPAGVDPAQLLGAFIIMCCLSVGSFKSTGFSCVLAWIVTGILMVMGWYTMGIPTFAFAGFLSIWIAISEAKEQQGVT